MFNLPGGLTCLLLLQFIPYALSQATSKGSVTDYAPSVNVECPNLSETSLIRVFTPQNQTLHPDESAFIMDREKNVLPGAWKDWLGDGSHVGYDLSSFSGFFPRVGVAIPGGGLRSAMYGASAMSALDSRNDSSKAAGTGGLLQVASYISGLSGGSWVTGSMFFNNWPNPEDLVFGNNQDLQGWMLDIPFVTPDGTDIFSDHNQEFYGSILWSVMAKADKGIDTSLTDPWSRLISFHFLNQTSRSNFFTNDTAHGAGQLWSQIPNIPAYQQRQTPFPIIVADSRPVGSNLTTTLALDSVVYEITPLELASYDPNLSAGMNLTYAGTHLDNGKADNGSACVTGFDQAGFVMGTSASLFNQILDFAQNTITDLDGSDSSGLLYLLARQLQEVRTRADDVANWPNPFKGLKNATFEDSAATWIELLDGSSNDENIPYGPLFVKARGLDVVVTLENSADIATNWPNGSSLLFTEQRQATLLRSSHQQFPPIPSSPEAFISTGVNMRPTFFGCDPSTPSNYPLVIYLPNSPPINGDDPVTNTATFKLSYSQKHLRLFKDQVFSNTLSGFSPNTNKPDPNWGTCLQCAAIDRVRYKITPVVPRSDACTACFKQYCFDPSNPPSKNELPGRKLNFVDPDPPGLFDFLGENKFKFIGGLGGLVGLIIILVGGLLWWRRRKNKKQVYQRVYGLHDDVLEHNSSVLRTKEGYALPIYQGER